MKRLEERDDIQLTDGSPVTPKHREIDPATGQQRGYVVLNPEERAKGFVRPVRRSYVHVGAPPPEHDLRELTEEEAERYAGKYGYAKFEPYPESESPVIGKFWTQENLDRVGAGCGTVTTMGEALAETYARDPKFYGGTFCCACREHFPVNEFVWTGTNERVGS